MKLYYYQDSERKGPVTSVQLRMLASKGEIASTTIVENEFGRQASAASIEALAPGLSLDKYFQKACLAEEKRDEPKTTPQKAMNAANLRFGKTTQETAPQQEKISPVVLDAPAISLETSELTPTALELELYSDRADNLDPSSRESSVDSIDATPNDRPVASPTPSVDPQPCVYEVATPVKESNVLDLPGVELKPSERDKLELLTPESKQDARKYQDAQAKLTINQRVIDAQKRDAFLRQDRKTPTQQKVESRRSQEFDARSVRQRQPEEQVVFNEQRFAAKNTDSNDNVNAPENNPQNQSGKLVGCMSLLFALIVLMPMLLEVGFPFPVSFAIIFFVWIMLRAFLNSKTNGDANKK